MSHVGTYERYKETEKNEETVCVCVFERARERERELEKVRENSSQAHITTVP